jgi:hypothetical protein
MIAPLFASDSVEVPLTLVARIFAKTLDPQGKLKGAAFKTEAGISQDLLSIIV